MSSLIRRIQRSVEEARPLFMGRGSKLGVQNPKAADLVARLKREESRK